MSSPSFSKKCLMVLKAVLPILILVLAGGIAFSIVKSAPQPERHPKPRQPRLVETIAIDVTKQTLTIEAWGQVQPVHQITLRSQVNGKIIAVNPELVPGGRFAAQETILRLEPADYVLAVRQRQSDLAKARVALRLEEGNQVVAKQEFDLLGATINDQEKSLVLRLPQLAAMKADVDAAAAALQSAKLSLSRTVIKAPFESTVVSRHIDLGTYVTTTSDLVTIAGTKEYWVELAVPMAQLRWITIPRTPDEPGSTVKLFQENVWGKDKFRTGRVVRLLTDLEPNGRMARLLVAIQDPLNLEERHAQLPRVLLGSYLRAEIQGQELTRLAKVDRRWIHDQDTVWLMNTDNTLAIRQVTIAYRGQHEVFISEGLETGDRLVVTDISAPTDGMPIRLNNSRSDTPVTPHGT
ncbi:efflux RND transporter periplasmic adaptor subunit [Candidatus Nitrospira allomarina]|uniref:Efflux RND transporter periplasmic adaptor subunit n=1 Tax=Candidatus Nitrospira allomarina TaxID=3020900 RepID=A0AA96GC57_9BACT|nr:efflux RND transporter periplasmic adaptor subunit [Candidatus Nitrospira allomarina]WNM56373.1 efflux RND transporter periplasmic adaptor subunit [Candidatus Nitrospira allomarina]